MAVHTWTGATDGDINNAANWSGGIPVLDGDVVVPGNVTRAMDTNMSAWAFDHLDSWTTARGFDADIGSSGAPLEVSIHKVVHRGGGNFYFSDDAGTSDLIVIASSNKDAISEIGGSTVDQIVVLRGNVTLTATLGVHQLWVAHLGSVNTDATVTIDAGAGNSDLLMQSGGVVSAANSRIDAQISAGSCELMGTGTTTSLAVTGGSCTVESSGTITDLAHLGGVLDLTREGVARTVTNLVHSGGTLRIDNLTTVTNRYDFAG